MEFKFIFRFVISCFICITAMTTIQARKTNTESNQIKTIESEGLEQVGSTHPVNIAKITGYAIKLRHTLKKWSTDDKSITGVATYTTKGERILIAQAYNQEFNRVLDKDFTNKLKDDYELLIRGMFLPQAHYLATEIRVAVKGLGTDETTLNEIMCCLSAHESKKLKNAYYELYKNELEKDIRDDTSGLYRTLLLSLTNNARNQVDTDNPKFKLNVAQSLKRINTGIPEHFQIKTTEKPKSKGVVAASVDDKFFVDKPTLINVLSVHSFPVIAKMADEFNEETGYELHEVIRKATTGEFQDLLLNILSFAQESRMEFYARKVYAGLEPNSSFMKKKDQRPLTRALVLLTKPELKEMMEVFRQKFTRNIIQLIEEKKSSYRIAVYAILRKADVDD